MCRIHSKSIGVYPAWLVDHRTAGTSWRFFAVAWTVRAKTRRKTGSGTPQAEAMCSGRSPKQFRCSIQRQGCVLLLLLMLLWEARRTSIKAALLP
eukprot:scaffold1625_cov170-Amphora_coffeaeformis.AAC.1